MHDDDEVGRLARQYAAEALRVLAEIAESLDVEPATRETARAELEQYLLRLKEIEDAPNTSPELRRDVENTKREFLSS